jgi:putative multicomponent Na+:H+ antiporter subunit B
MLVFQVNPYHALVIRGILGAIAALVYTVLGAPDVALTEALVGTLLAITLYAVAVRSSLVFRLGVLNAEATESASELDTPEVTPLQELVNHLNRAFSDYHLRVELVPYGNSEDLDRALMEKDVHATCERGFGREELGAIAPSSSTPPYRITTRLQRLYDLMNRDFLTAMAQLSYIDPAAV